MCTNGIKGRRQRLHELMLALIAQQGELELMDGEHPSGLVAGGGNDDPVEVARSLKRSRGLLSRYQALVRTAVTLDALLDEEEST